MPQRNGVHPVNGVSGVMDEKPDPPNPNTIVEGECPTEEPALCTLFRTENALAECESQHPDWCHVIPPIEFENFDFGDDFPPPPSPLLEPMPLPEDPAIKCPPPPGSGGPVFAGTGGAGGTGGTGGAWDSEGCYSVDCFTDDCWTVFCFTDDCASNDTCAACVSNDCPATPMCETNVNCETGDCPDSVDIGPCYT